MVKNYYCSRAIREVCAGETSPANMMFVRCKFYNVSHNECGAYFATDKKCIVRSYFKEDMRDAKEAKEKSQVLKNQTL